MFQYKNRELLLQLKIEQEHKRTLWGLAATEPLGILTAVLKPEETGRFFFPFEFLKTLGNAFENDLFYSHQLFCEPSYAKDTRKSFQKVQRLFFWFFFFVFGL